MRKVQIGAAAKGVTYAQVFERAAEKIDLGKIGLESGLKIRRSATGARILELPKAAPEKAEKLVHFLRSVQDGVADVVQPIKWVGMRVGGDSAISEKVKLAICRAANYPNESVHVSEIRWGYGLQCSPLPCRSGLELG